MDAPTVLLLLNVGPTELVLLGALFLLLFGVDKIPDLARAVGRVQAEFTKARNEVRRELRSAEERAFDEQIAFERSRERQMQAQRPERLEEARVRDAARALGIDEEGRPLADVKRDVASRMGGEPAPAGVTPDREPAPDRPSS